MPQDIFRKYPDNYEGVIPILCANLEELDDPEAKASLIWIIGEYADKIDNADELLAIFVQTFTEESYQVQLQTLTAVVKLFLKRPDNAQGLVQRVLETATKDCDSPDVRDRAYIYWRLLSTDPAAASVSFFPLVVQAILLIGMNLALSGSGSGYATANNATSYNRLSCRIRGAVRGGGKSCECLS